MSKASAYGTVILIIVVFALFIGFLSYKQVPEGHEGVTKNWGAVTGETLDSGAHWKIPIQQGVQDVEVRPRTYTMSASQGEGEQSRADAVTVKTVNGSSVDVDLTVRYRIDNERADIFVEEWNQEEQMEQRLIRPTIRSVLRDEASSLQTTGDGSIYTQEGRQALEVTAQRALEDEFDGQPILLEAVQIRNIDLPDQIDETLDEKEQAKQEVQVEMERVRQEEQRAEQARVEAQGEADVIQTQGEALRDNPIVLEARYIEALGDGSVFVIGSGGENGEGTPIIIDGSNVSGASTNGTSIPEAPGIGG